MATVSKVREIDPFFEDAINQIFIHSDKTAFIMDGGIGWKVEQFRYARCV